MGDQVSLSIFHSDIGIPINFQEESGLISFWSIELNKPLEVSSDVRPPVQIRQGTRVFPRVHTEDSDFPSSCDMKASLHSSHFREIQPYFKSGNLGINSTWGSKLRVPLTHLLLTEGSSLGACGKVAYLFNRILGISSLLETICGAWSFPRVPVLKLVFL